MSLNKSFVLRLFDFSSSNLMAVEVVAILYVIGIVFAGLMGMAIVMDGFSNGLISGIGSLILAPLVFFLYLILLKFGLEEIIVTLKISEHS